MKRVFYQQMASNDYGRMRHPKQHNHQFLLVNEIHCLCLRYQCALCGSLIVLAVSLAQNCYDPNIQVEEFVKSPQPWEYMKNDELPQNYDPYACILAL